MPATLNALNSEFDTIVIGGGIMGLCVTWFLAAEGSAVMCLDDGVRAGSIANAGSLHVQMQSRVLQLFPERVQDYEQTLPIYPRAVDYWSEIAGQLDEDVELRIGGGLMVADTAGQMDILADKCRRERHNGVDTSLLGRRELTELAPYLNPEVHGAAFCPKEGKINPLLANAALRRRLLSQGGSIRTETRVDRIERRDHSYVVHAAAESFEAGRVVIAAGAGSGEVAATLGVRLPTKAEPLHMNITEAAEPFMHHLLQHAARRITMKQMHTGQLLIGGGWPALPGQQIGAPLVMLDSLLGNLGLAQKIVPGITGLRLIRSWAGINPTIDLLSVLGEVTSLPGLFVAVPGDAGYTLGPYCARLLVDEMAGRAADFPLAIFSPARF